MALILCIETGTDICSVGLVKDGELLSLRESDAGRDHAGRVAVFVDELLRENELDPSDIDAVAVGEGPGSYTGLRIGVSFAKGLCYGLNKPLIAVSSLASLAQVAIEDYQEGIIDIDNWEETLLCPMIDARRMEVYTAIFDTTARQLTAVTAEVVTAETFATQRAETKHFVIFGSGAAKCQEILGAELINIVPSVRGMARLAEEKYCAGDFADVAYFEPYYLKDFVVTTTRKKLF